MKVAHLTSAHPRDDVRIFLKECRSLARMGHDVTLVVADGLGHQQVDGVSIVDVGASKGRLSRMLRTRQRVLAAALALKADVYHLHDPELLTLCAPLARCGHRVLFDAHEDVPKQILSKHYLPTPLRKLIAWGYARYEYRVCARIDGVIAATPTIRDKFLRITPHTVDVNNYPILGELDAPPATSAEKVGSATSAASPRFEAFARSSRQRPSADSQPTCTWSAASRNPKSRSRSRAARRGVG